jgi:fluoroquinolone transport system ATP-binding protein
MIEVERLTYSYPGAPSPAVQALDFAVARGEVFGFLGPSGAGKSTTQKILIRLLRGYSGRAAVLGRELSEWGQELYERIGVSFELPNHFLKLTARENLAYFGALFTGRGRTPEEVLEAVGLLEDADLPVERFSKGMKVRLNVARALLHRPDLLFLDEPTSGLDPGNSRRIRDLVRRERAEGRTVFLTTHDMSVAGELCDRVAFIVDGSIALVGAPDALRLRFGEPTLEVRYEEGGALLRRDFPMAGLGEAEEFLALLRGGGVRTLHTREASLEEVFIRVTGRELP